MAQALPPRAAGTTDRNPPVDVTEQRSHFTQPSCQARTACPGTPGNGGLRRATWTRGKQPTGPRAAGTRRAFLRVRRNQKKDAWLLLVLLPPPRAPPRAPHRASASALTQPPTAPVAHASSGATQTAASPVTRFRLAGPSRRTGVSKLRLKRPKVRRTAATNAAACTRLPRSRGVSAAGPLAG